MMDQLLVDRAHNFFASLVECREYCLLYPANSDLVQNTQELVYQNLRSMLDITDSVMVSLDSTQITVNDQEYIGQEGWETIGKEVSDIFNSRFLTQIVFFKTLTLNEIRELTAFLFDSFSMSSEFLKKA